MPPESKPTTPEVSQATIDMAKASFERCCAQPDFLAHFYRNFFTNCPDAEPMFAKTEFERQHKLLRHAIGLLLIFPNHMDEEPTVLKRVADRHGRRDLDVDPSYYPAFVESLMQTVREHDAEFSDAIDDAWHRTIAPGVAYMQSRY
ncbi:MAG: globin [Gemmatimonadota bacterium]|nr:globin [Gemmatimonadota bacterium]